MKGELAPNVNQALLGRWEPVYRSRLNYLVTWSTRGRRPVLRERHARLLGTLLPALCEERGFTLLDVAVGQDHVHILVGLRPAQSIASVVREIKGRSSLAMLSQHPELRVWLGGNLIWDERYAVETVSPARLQKVQERLRAIHGPHEDLAAAS